MSSKLRIIALIFIVYPFAAMFSEPFFEAIFDHLGWDTETWVAPIMADRDGLSGLWPFVVGAALFGLGVWVHYFAQRLATTSPSVTPIMEAALRWKARIAVLKEPAPVACSAANGQHLIAKPDEFFRMPCKRTEDGHDISASFYTRNRSKEALWIESSQPQLFKLSNGVVGKGGGVVTTPTKQEQTKELSLVN